MRKMLMLGSLVGLLVPATSRAQFQVGARVGFAPAMGSAFQEKATEFDAAETMKMKDSVKSQIPLQLEASYKITSDIAVGPYFSYGFGQVGAAECHLPGVDCSANVLRVGVQGIYTFDQLHALLPWAGVGLGYERASLALDTTGFEQKYTASGFEANLQVGGDYRVNDVFSVGPYVMFSVGQYTSAKAEETGEASQDLEINKKLHQWFGFGIAGKFNL